MHHLHVKWSNEDQQFVGTCEEYPSLSYLADTADAAGEGISELAYATRDDIAAGRMPAAERCEDCGCWTGGADCPHCVPGAPHPRGRS